MSALFTPYKLKDVSLRNRIAVAPMCQYQARDGFVNDWHIAHYASLARGGAALVIVEATAVSPEGRITPGCTGLWNDEQIDGMSQIAASIKSAGSVPGIQIGHAGRKASANLPWEGDDHIGAEDPRGWETIAPSPIAFGGALSKIPKEMTLADINSVKADFVSAALRARDAGFEWLELHFAHGYLASSFYSGYANQRTDLYGGNQAGRNRFLLETLEAVREVWPENLPLTVRFGVVEFDGHDEETLAQSIALIKQFKISGLDFVSTSMGFSAPVGNVPWGPAFLVPFASRIRSEAGIAVGSAWLLDAPNDANKAIADKQLDIVMMGRALLANPHYL
ncbi:MULTISPECIES: NADH:flavin oxidoreductase/NADH oxidase [unclassified Thalassospira]|uniref:NADH:flavin oxidoreductase/NADH oxidase n=1 Tax=unclassified Thalassospira TaxID=2648997 RepID=UPI000EC7FA1B|nr:MULTISPECIES: NADH:flavin oxidoreductase/NADH oxidase [unclassified Thalassospira]HAI29773.1 NADH:flavin oxidoreductase [Thalassospira sp.]|tara:strand:+ start:17042 stop:18049 length:1008 start_codon:yes stop_codon:yes gene_type:complete